MRARALHVLVAIALLLPVASGAQAPGKPPAGAVVVPAGQRMPIVLTAEQREYILNEMRMQLDLLYVVMESLSRGDMQTIATVARRRGSASLDRPTAEVYDRTPAEFRSVIRDSRSRIDRLADLAETNPPRDAVERELAGLLQTCNACHGTWQLRIAAAKPGAR